MIEISLSEKNIYEGKEYVYITFHSDIYDKENKRLAISISFKDLRNFRFIDIPDTLRNHANEFEKLYKYKLEQQGIKDA